MEYTIVWFSHSENSSVFLFVCWLVGLKLLIACLDHNDISILKSKES